MIYRILQFLLDKIPLLSVVIIFGASIGTVELLKVLLDPTWDPITEEIHYNISGEGMLGGILLVFVYGPLSDKVFKKIKDRAYEEDLKAFERSFEKKLKKEKSMVQDKVL